MKNSTEILKHRGKHSGHFMLCKEYTCDGRYIQYYLVIKKNDKRMEFEITGVYKNDKKAIEIFNNIVKNLD